MIKLNFGFIQFHPSSFNVNMNIVFSPFHYFKDLSLVRFPIFNNLSNFDNFNFVT